LPDFSAREKDKRTKIKKEKLKDRERDAEEGEGERRVVARVVKAVPPPITSEDMVNEKEKEKENILYEIQCLFSHNTNTPHKIKTILDSGANETMINDLSFAKTLEQQKTGIQTAGKNTKIEQGVWGTLTHTSFPISGKRATFGQNNRAVFCENISENLSSVGRLCENNFIVIFDSDKCKIFTKKNFRVGGECVHTEGRDPHTGLYPLTLYTKSQTQQHTHCSPGGGGVLSSGGAGRKIRIENTRESLCFFVQWARTSIEKEKQERTKNNTHSYNFLHNTQAFLARFYTRENMSDLEKWHEKLGHVGMKQIRKCNIQGLKIPKKPFRCESCIKGKIHILPHKKNKNKQSQYKTGEVLHTDLQGPYVRTLHNERYSQIFVDIVSRKVWSVKLIHKYDSDKAIKKVIDESKIITGRKIKFLRTDGDGIFGRSKTFQELKEKEQFIHERPSPYDHNQNSIIDRECRTLLEGTSTNLFRSGTPSNFWGDLSTISFLPKTTFQNTKSHTTVKRFLFPRTIFMPEKTKILI
jgi:hypothetical protein